MWFDYSEWIFLLRFMIQSIDRKEKNFLLLLLMLQNRYRYRKWNDLVSEKMGFNLIIFLYRERENEKIDWLIDGWIVFGWKKWKKNMQVSNPKEKIIENSQTQLNQTERTKILALLLLLFQMSANHLYTKTHDKFVIVFFFVVVN